MLMFYYPPFPILTCEGQYPEAYIDLIFIYQNQDTKWQVSMNHPYILFNSKHTLYGQPWDLHSMMQCTKHI